MEPVLQARLVGREEEAARVVLVGGRRRLLGGVEFAAVRDAVADHAGHFHGVGVGAGVCFADVGAEGALGFGDAAVAEGVVEFLFGSVGEFGDGGSWRG